VSKNDMEQLNAKELESLFEARYRALAETLDGAVVRFAPDGEITFVSPSYCRLFRQSPDDLMGASFYDFANLDERKLIKNLVNQISEQHPAVRLDQVAHRVAGKELIVDWRIAGVFGDSDAATEFQAIGEVASGQDYVEAQLAESQLRYRQAVRIAGIGYWIWDEIENRLSYCSEEAAAIYGVSVEEALRRSSTLEGNIVTIHKDDKDDYEATIRDAYENNRGYEITVRFMHASGGVRYIHELAEAVLDENGKIIQTIGTVQDVTDDKHAQQEIERLANQDALTGLPTRRLFFDRLSTAIVSSTRDERFLAVLYIDLDGFKHVNDTHGHLAGDKVLKEVASRLIECVRAADTVGRLGGDEFAALLGGHISKENVATIAAKIIKSISEPYAFEEHQVTIGASIGIALLPDHGDTPEALLIAADQAMYEVKRLGKNDFRFAASGNPVDAPVSN